MDRKVYRLFSAVMVLVLAVTLSGIGLIQGAAPAEAVTALKWVEIPTPDEDDFQLYPTSDVGVVAVTPDGATLFAAVWNDSSSNWHIFKSMDGGYTWSETGYYNNVVVGWGDNNDIVDIVAHPLWETRPYLYVATQTRTYYSQNGGNSFLQLGNALGGPQINCMDVAVNKDGETRVAIGTGIPSPAGTAGSPEAGNDVYLLYDTWVRQGVDKNFTGIDAVLDVAFAPTYGDEALTGSGWIFALVRGTHTQGGVSIDQAVLRCETQEVASTGDIGNWGAPVSDGVFYHNGVVECATSGILADHGRMAFAEDFADQTSVFVGMKAWGPTSGGCTLGASPRGDVFRCDVSTDIVSPSTYEDLNVVRTPIGDKLECNIWSLDVSGDADTAYILAGLYKSDIAGALSTWQSPVHFSSDGGGTWMPSYKPPSGLTDVPNQNGKPNVVMAPDFGSSGIAYCGESGLFSGMWVSATEGTTWNGRGLLDMMTLRISSIAVSPNYASDETMFMVQAMQLYYMGAPFGTPSGESWMGIPWQTQDAGAHWEVILAENLLFPLPGVNAEWVELPHDWPSDDTIFITGRHDTTYGNPQSMVVQSRDGGNTFTNFISGPSVGGIARPPYTGASWDTPNADTIIIGDSMGTVYITENAGMTWCAREGSYPCSQQNSIPIGEAITDLVEKDGALLIGTESSGVYLCYDWQADFNIQRVGNYVANPTDWASVAFDANYDTNDIIYCGIWGGNGEIWRCNLGEGTTWEQISDTRNTNVPTKWLTPPVHFADPPINGSVPLWVGSWNGLDPILVGQGGNSLMCGEEGTLYTIDVTNGLGWRCTDPELETITLGEEPLWEPLGDGLGWPYDTSTPPYTPIITDGILSDLEVVTGSNILFAIGWKDGSYPGIPTIWTYHDTLTADLGPLDLIRPTDGAIGVGTLAADNTEACLTLQWEPATDATKYEWEIGTGPELKVDGGFVSLWAHAQFLTYFEGDADTARFTNGEAIAGCLPPGETYYWHVRVVQPFQSPWSEIWSFTTMPTSTGERPLLTSPENGATNVIRRPAFTWTQAVGAQNYELTVWECANAGSPVIEKTGDNAVNGLFYQTTQDLKYSTNYCWQVKAIGGNNPVSASGTFTTLAQPVEEEEEGTPYWVWVVIGVSALMLVAVIVLIKKKKKA